MSANAISESELCGQCQHKYVHHGDRAIIICSGDVGWWNGYQKVRQPCLCTGFQMELTENPNNFYKTKVALS